MINSINRDRAGIALFFTLGIIFIISIMVFGMIFYMRSQVHFSENYVDGAVALLLAEAGIEESLFTIRSQMNDPQHPFYQMVAEQQNGSMDMDLSRLSNGTENVAPIVKNGQVKARVSWQLDQKGTDELAFEGVPRDIFRIGYLTIDSMGEYNGNKKQVEIKKVLKAFLVKSLNSNSLGVIAPQHGFYLNHVEKDSFKNEKLDFWDPWSFTVLGGKTYMKDGAKIDLSKWLMLTKLHSELDHPWLDMGIGWTGWNGGGDFASTDLEYDRYPINRCYNKWQGILSWPWWQESSSELYHSRTRQVEPYEEKSVNVYPVEAYKNLANRVVDPKSNPSHGQYFTNVTFTEAFGRNQVTYKNVVPLYGWGDWRNVKNDFHRWFGNPTKAFDTSKAVEINGLTYIKGDVFLEGWVKGQGLLVVEGNLYVGGDVLMLPDDSGADSALGVIVLRDKSWDHSIENPKTGKIIYEPHHDSDWSRFGITHPFRNLSPRLEGGYYAEGGMQLKTDSSMEKLTNMDIVGNLVVDRFDRSLMPNDVRITYYNWQKVLEKSSYDYSVDHRPEYSKVYELAIQKEIVRWRQVEATL